MGRAARRPRCSLGGQELAWPPWAADPLDGGLRRSGMERQSHAGALERRQPADRPLLRHADRADLVLPDVLVGRAAVRLAGVALALPGPEGADRVGVPQ